MSALARISARPMCGRCGRLVDTLTERVDDFLGTVVFVAYCHGETERVALNLRGIGGIDPGYGVAFSQAKELAR